MPHTKEIINLLKSVKNDQCFGVFGHPADIDGKFFTDYYIPYDTNPQIFNKFAESIDNLLMKLTDGKVRICVQKEEKWELAEKIKE